MYVEVKPSTQKAKKLMAIFYDNKNVKLKTTHFGSFGYEDYTIHKDDSRKQRYISRHKNNENWNDYTSAGCLSRYILWNKTTLNESIKDYCRMFKLSLKIKNKV